jgi:hypothetical protein
VATKKAKTKAKARPVRKTAAKLKAAPKKHAPKKAAAKKPAPPPALAKWSAPQKSEFDAIRARAQALSPGLKRTDFDNDGNPLPGPWASMLADLHAWARKYKVTLETHEHDHTPGAAVGAPAGGATPIAYGGDCPGSFTKVEKKKVYNVTYTNTYNCTLRRQTLLGRCVYDCTLSYTI